MQIITQNGSQRQKYMDFFKQYIFRGMHHNDVKFTHNIHFMVLHGMMEGFNQKIMWKKIMWKSKKIAIFLSKLCIPTHGTLILK